MLGTADSWPHQVEIVLERRAFDARLRTIEDWLQDWEIPYRIGSTLLDVGALRVRFAEEKFARAFIHHHGGRAIPGGEIAAALNADKVDDDVYERLAREYPD